MQNGKIARIMDKGYGFISVDGQDKDLFFHSNELVGVQFDELSEGDEVVFDATSGPKGPQASNVRRAEDAGSGDSSEETSEEDAE